MTCETQLLTSNTYQIYYITCS